ncbi:MAG: S8 family serine peptidase [Chloroflexi bacterium]|nr:S8 family serine peptidase [Chloroflexota bacterium]
MRLSVFSRIALSLALALTVAATLSAASPLPSGHPLPPPPVSPAKHPRLASSLVALADAYSRQGLPGARALAAQSGLVLRDATVEVVVETDLDAMDAITAKAPLGATVQATYDNLVQMSVPLSALAELADLPGVQYVRPPARPVVNAITSEGVALSNANAWHTAGHKGSGVKIAVLDVGFTGYQGLLGTELPPTVTVRSFTSSGDIGGGGEDHGTACAEIVHDMAPQASLYLVNYDSDVFFLNAVDWLIAQGVSIISHSAGLPRGGSGDGTGLICDAVARATNAGILWVNSAGNYAQRHYDLIWSDPEGNGWLNWAMGDETNEFDASVGEPIYLFLRWDDPWGGAGNDYDLYLYRQTGSGERVLVASSTNSQNGDPGHQPWEEITITAPASGRYHVAVWRVHSSRNPNFDLFLFNPTGRILEHVTARSSLIVPADAPASFTVGAVPVSNPATSEPFSSRGPTRSGLIKPDIAAYSGVSTNRYGYNGFVGTSAACPHVAGAAALVRGANPTRPMTYVRQCLEDNAKDLGAPGKDNVFGRGRLYLGAPFTLVTPTPTPTVTPPLPPTGDERAYNCGGPAYTAPNGLTWLADQPYAPGSWGFIGGGSVSTTEPITLTEEDPLYQTQRVGMSGYAFDLPNGNYLIELRFAELTITEMHQRVFDVRVEGQTILRYMDIFALAGNKTAYARQLLATVSDGQLNIDFPPVIGQAMVNAILIRSAPTITPTPTLPNWYGNLYMPIVLKYYPPLPATPMLNPIDNADGDNRYTVSWTTAAWATSYHLQEDDNSAFSSPHVVYNGPDTSVELTDRPLGVTYYYRVRAENAYGNSAWSNIRSVYVPGCPAKPTLNEISDPEGDGNYTVSWSADLNAETYTLEEDDHVPFTSPAQVYSGPATSVALAGRNPLATYFYRVRATGHGCTSPWSDLKSLPPNRGTWQINNETGGVLTLEIIGLGARSFSPGTHYWNLAPGMYTYNARSWCGTRTGLTLQITAYQTSGASEVWTCQGGEESSLVLTLSFSLSGR